jgi:hypothetical protein
MLHKDERAERQNGSGQKNRNPIQMLATGVNRQKGVRTFLWTKILLNAFDNQ